MKILLLGGDGQVGFELQRALAPLGPVTAFDHAGCDVTDTPLLRKVIRGAHPDVIVNAAAYTAVDRAETEPALAHATNAAAPAIIGSEAARAGALVVHYSTDYVFDGTKEDAYRERDRPNPVNVYGASKLAGEQALQQSGARHLIFRTGWVVGMHGQNFAKTILRLASTKTTLDVVADQWGAPTPAALIADVTAVCLRAAANASDTDFCGLYHLASSGRTQWHEYACRVVDKAQRAGCTLTLPSTGIRAVATSATPRHARRPCNSTLDTRKLRDTFGLHLPDWREAVDPVLGELLQTLRSTAVAPWRPRPSDEPGCISHQAPAVAPKP
jgi:dTDP-4-dehydrorhamnose reductase